MSDERRRLKELRAKAEARMDRHSSGDAQLGPEEMAALLHEVQVHQIELELQNDELKRTQARLEETRDQYTWLFQHAPTGYLALDGDSFIIMANQTFADMVGRQSHELVGMPFHQLLHPDYGAAFLARFRAFSKSPEGKSMEARLNAGGGPGPWVLLEGRPHQAPPGSEIRRPGLVLAASDITEQKQAQAKAEHLNSLLRALRQVSEIITREQRPSHILQKAVDSLVNIRGYESAWALLLDPAGRPRKWLNAGIGEAAQELEPRILRGELPSCAQKSMTAHGGVLVSGTSDDCQDCPLREIYQGVVSFTVPLAYQKSVFGVLTVAAPGELAEAADEQEILREMADDLAFALHAAEQAEREAELAGSLSLANTVVESSPVMLFRWRNEEGWPVDYVSANVENLGYEPGQLISGEVTYDDMIHPADRQRVADEVAHEIAAGNDSYQQEYRLLDTQGKAHWVMDRTVVRRDAHGRVVIFQGVVQDITSRKEAELELAEQRRLLKMVLDGIPDVVALQKPDLTIITYNRAGYELLGKPPEEVDGRRCYELIGRQTPCEICSTQTAVDTGETAQVEKYVPELGIWVEARSVPVLDQSGKASMVIEILRDITKDKESEAQRRNLETQLRQAQKMEAIGTLAGGIAHDFNNILAAIMGYCELTMDDLPKTGLARSNLEQVMVAGQRAKRLVQQILSFARQNNEELKPVRPGAVVAESLRLLRASLPSSIEMQAQVDEELGAVKADPTQLHQLMMNLCTNAAQAMGEKGVLRVGVEAARATAGLTGRHPELAERRLCLITVSDSGPGIPPDLLERVFEPFFTTKEPGAGTGMGLAVVHGIVARQGGAIEVESSPGEGATFRIWLPLELQEGAEAGDENAGGGPPGGDESVMLVDDEAAITQMAAEMLGRLGYRVSAFTSSTEARDAFRATPHAFDILITDMTMADVSGADLAREVLKARPEMPVILCTGYSSLIDEDHARRMGIYRLIMKPMAMRELCQAVREALDRAVANNPGEKA